MDILEAISSYVESYDCAIGNLFHANYSIHFIHPIMVQPKINQVVGPIISRNCLVNSGIISCISPTIIKSAILAIGAFSSLLTAIFSLAPFILRV